MARIMPNTLVKRLISGILTCMLMFTLIPDTRAIASEVQNNKTAVVETVQEDTAKQAEEESDEADAKKAESDDEDKVAKSESEDPETSDDQESGDADSAAKDEVAQLEASVYADQNFKEQIAAEEFSGSVTLKGSFAKDVQARAWVEKEKEADAENSFIAPNGDVLSQVAAYGIEFRAGENAWSPNEAFEVKLVDDDLKTALREGKQFTVLRLNDKDKTAVECPILVNEEEGDIDSLRFVTEEPGVFLVCAPSDPKEEASAEPAADDTVEEPKAEASSDDTPSTDTKAEASDSAKEDAKEEVKEAAKEDEKKSDDKDAKKSEEKDTKAPKEKDADKDTSEEESATKATGKDKSEQESANQDESAEKDADKDESSKDSEDKDAKKSDTTKEDAESKDEEQAEESVKSERDESDAAKKVVAAKKSNRKAAARMAGPDQFVSIGSNAEIMSAVGNTKFPVYYAFANGQIVPGGDIGMATELTSGRLFYQNDIVSAGADVSSFQSSLRSALGIAGATVTVGYAYINNGQLIHFAFEHANGNVYHTYTNYNTTTDGYTNYVRNEINNNQYMLLGNDKIVVRLTLAGTGKYAADGITYGTVANATVTATATVLDADEHGSDDLPATVTIAGVPYTVVDNVTSYTKDSVTYTIDRSKKTATATSLNADEHGSDDLPKTITIAGEQYDVVDSITSYTKDGVTYELDRGNKMITSPSGPAFNDLNETNNGITVNGVRFTYSVGGTVTYKGVTYTIDPAKNNGATEATASAYRAATIGDGTQRTDAAVVEYGKTTTPAPIKSVTTTIPIEKKLTSNETADNTLAALKNDKFTFTVTQDASNPVGGAQVVLASEPSADSTDVTITAKRLLKDADKSASQAEVTYTLKGDDAPWQVTFTKPGTYKFVIHEEDTDADGVTYDAVDKTATYHVLEEEGSLRLAQSNREASDPILATKVTDATVEALDLDHLFNTAYALGTSHRKAPTIEQEGSTIVMNLNEDTSGVITTSFTFDFSRSFEVTGRLGTPDSDAIALALHGEEALNAYRWDCNNGIDNFHFGNGHKDNELKILRYGYVPPNTDLVQGFLLNLMTRDLDDLRGWYAYKVENNVRMPYVASSGLNGDVRNTDLHYDIVPDAKSYESFNATDEKYPNAWSDFKLRFECRDATTGAGKLTLVVMDKTIEFDDFVASDIIGADKWQDAHFSIGSSVQDTDQGGLEFDTVRYLNEAVKSVTTSFWADRDKDGAYETQVNTTNSLAVPGESILVRHTIAREDETSDYFYERALVRQLIDVTSNKAIVPSDYDSVVTYPQGDMSKTVEAQNVSKRSFNSDTIKNGMKIKVFANTTTNFEYKITAPTEGGHIVAESALFGQPPFNNIQTDSYGFKTELITEQLPSFTNTAEVYPVCKIVDGSKTNIFFSLKDAVDFADDSDNGLTNKNVTIQMLVPSHTIGEAITAAHGSNKITITTASTSDSTYPYRGDAGTQATLVRGFSGDSVITSTSSLELNDITMDGNSGSYTGGLAGGLVQMNGSATPTLTLSGGAKLMNSALDNDDNALGGGAVYLDDNCSLTMVDQATIENCTSSTNGGAIATGEDATVTLRGDAKIQTCVAQGFGGAIHAAKSTVTVARNAQIVGNSAQNGGGISTTGKGTVNLAGGSLSQNVAQNNGGGAYFDGAQEVSIAKGFLLSKNEAADGDGGAIYASACKIDMETGAVIGGDSADNANRAKNGGGIAMEGGVTLHSPGGIKVSHNVATENGGGIYVKTDDVTNSLQLASGDAVQYNTAVNGGGMYMVGANNKVTLNGASDGAATVSANTATTSGGGAYVESGTLSLYGNSGVQFNVAGTNAGGVYLGTNGTLNVSDAASVSENAVGDAQSNVSSNVYLPGEGNGSKAGGVIMVGGELTGTIGVFAEHADHDGLAVATNEQFAQTDSKNTTYKTDFNKVFKNDRNGEAKAVISKTDDKDIEWEADAVNLTITESTEGEYADQTKEFELTLTSDELKGTTVETEADGTAGTLAFDESGKATVKLAHDKSVVLKGLKKATSLTVVSEDVAGYATTYDVTVGESTNADLQQCAVTMSNEASVIVHNEFDGVPATGLSDSANAWLCAIAISAILFVASWLHRRRHAA